MAGCRATAFFSLQGERCTLASSLGADFDAFIVEPKMKRLALSLWLALLIFSIKCFGVPGIAKQDNLKADTDIHGRVLEFDWPSIQIGVGSYEEGPTGLTIFRFPHRAVAAVDVRGGSPGTVNTDALRSGYEVDAIVFAGGSAYGEEAITATQTGLKDDGIRGGTWDNVALVAGAIVYDFQAHRLNEIYPDKRLAQATLHALRPGVFPLGAQGAGRMAMQGFFFGWPVHSGQGGAFRQVGDVKIAAFVVINALGAITDRDGNVVKDNRGLGQSNKIKMSESLAHLPESRGEGWTPLSETPGQPGRDNTTISLVVTNEKLTYAELQRLAVQVHTSMARAIQPFSTQDDGDTLFALSTAETTNKSNFSDLSTMAGEIMWDAILASVPEEPAFNPPAHPVEVSPDDLAAYRGTYRFGPDALLKITISNGKLTLDPGKIEFFDLKPNRPVTLQAISSTEFYIESRYHTRISFERDSFGKITQALINPGQWQQSGGRESD
jgi:L-aminopeptidase/D-esterase-like protein